MARKSLTEQLRQNLFSNRPDGPFTLKAMAWAVKGDGGKLVEASSSRANFTSPYGDQIEEGSHGKRQTQAYRDLSS